MLSLFAIIIALALGGAIGYLALEDSGYLLLTWGSFTIETTLWLALVVWLGTTVLLLLGYQICVDIINLPQRAHRSWVARKRCRARQRSHQGIVDWLNGNWERAYKLARKGLRTSETPLLNNLIAADAALQHKQYTAARTCLDDAKLLVTDATTNAEQFKAVRLTLILFEARLARAQGALKQAAEQLHPYLEVRYPKILILYQEICYEQQDWGALQPILPKLETILSAEAFTALSLQVSCGTIENICDDNNIEQHLFELNRHWRSTPQALRNNAKLILLYVDKLVALNAHAAAENVLRKILRQRFNTALVLRYAALRSPEFQQKMIFLEELLKTHTKEPQLLLALARLCQIQELWGQAENYFLAALRFGGGAQVHFEYGKLLDIKQQPEQARKHYHQALKILLS